SSGCPVFVAPSLSKTLLGFCCSIVIRVMEALFLGGVERSRWLEKGPRTLKFRGDPHEQEEFERDKIQ
ncbi:hypothetical protein CDAR_91661, partial [Caerostris darwini]